MHYIKTAHAYARFNCLGAAAVEIGRRRESSPQHLEGPREVNVGWAYFVRDSSRSASKVVAFNTFRGISRTLAQVDPAVY